MRKEAVVVVADQHSFPSFFLKVTGVPFYMNKCSCSNIPQKRCVRLFKNMRTYGVSPLMILCDKGLVGKKDGRCRYLTLQIPGQSCFIRQTSRHNRDSPAVSFEDVVLFAECRVLELLTNSSGCAILPNKSGSMFPAAIRT